MIILLSPAKTLDFNRKLQSINHTQAVFLKEANTLAKTMHSYTVEDLLQTMVMSERLALLSYDRFQNWESGDVEEKQAGAAFKGEAYNGLDLPSLDSEDLEFAQKHLRILSGLYGSLRPYDLIKPYRLEMGSKLKQESLYSFWKGKVTTYLNDELSKNGQTLINLASKEYYSVIDQITLNTSPITPIFKEKKGDKLKTIVVYTKKARGMMARYIIENRITKPEDIKTFNKEGYLFNEKLSSNNEWTFVR